MNTCPDCLTREGGMVTIDFDHLFHVVVVDDYGNEVWLPLTDARADLLRETA